MKFILCVVMSFGSLTAMQSDRDSITRGHAQKIVEMVHDVAQRKYGFSNPDNITVNLKYKHCFHLNENPTDKGIILQCKNKIPTKLHLSSGTLEFAEINRYTHGANGLFLQDILRLMSCTQVDCEHEQDPTIEYFRILQIEEEHLPYPNFKTPSKH